MSDTDDIWGDDGSQNDNSIDYERAIAEKEWARMHENFGNEGYREGIEEGKDDHTLQQGFNRGWTDGFRYGHELGKLRGLISPLVEYVESQPATTSGKFNIADRDQWIKDAKTLLSELAAIDIENVYDKEYFDDKKGPVPVAPASATMANKQGGSCCKSGEDTSKGNAEDGCCQSNGAQSQNSNLGSTSVSSGIMKQDSGCCQSGSNYSSCCKSSSSSSSPSSTSPAATTPSSTMLDTSPEGSEYSKPEAVIKAFRDRASRLLQQANLGHLLVVK